MNQLETGEVPETAQAVSDLQNELAEVLRQRAAISAVLRAIASSPHDLQPIFETILDSARRLCQAEVGTLRVSEQAGFRLVAINGNLTPSPPELLEHSGHISQFAASRSPVHIPDLAARELYRRGDPYVLAMVNTWGLRTVLYVPMVKDEKVIGVLIVARTCVQPFTDKQIELVTDFAAQAAIALQITRREREYREIQNELAHANRVATVGQLTASIAHEVKQPIAATVTGAQAAQRWLNMQPPNLAEVGDQLLRIVREGKRAGDIIDRIRDLIKKAPLKKEPVNINEAIREVLEFTHGETVKNGVSVQTDLAQDLPLIECDRVQLQQVMLNLIVNGAQAMSDVAERPRDLLISTETTEYGVRVGVLDTGPGLRPESLPHLFEPFYTTKPHGIGMGLSICRSIIEAHGGRLWATGHTPQGAFFQFTIPARPA
jgi:signal transduction histidine kinase